MGHTPTLTHCVCCQFVLFVCLFESRPVTAGEASSAASAFPPWRSCEGAILASSTHSPPPTSWFLLVPPGSSWLFSVSPGVTWFLLVNPGFYWFLLVNPGFSWLILVSPGSPLFLLVSPKLIPVSRGSIWFLQHDRDGSPQCWKLLPEGSLTLPGFPVSTLTPQVFRL